MQPRVYAGATRLEIEDFLLGRISMAELLDVLTEALGEKLYIEPALNKGEISIKIRGYDLGADATVEELTDAVSGEDADLEITISGSDLLVYELKPGNYSIYASVISKADGTIVMNIR